MPAASKTPSFDLSAYGTDDLHADADGNVYLWLPDGTYGFSVEGIEGRWTATVSGADVVADFTVVPELEELHIESVAVSNGVIVLEVSSVPAGWIDMEAASLRVRAAAGLPLPEGDAALLPREDVGIKANGDGSATVEFPRAADTPQMFYRVESSH